MMPPDCPLCDRTLEDLPNEEFTIVSFCPEPGYVPSDTEGHPDHEVWFCSVHAPAAAELSDLSCAHAMQRLRARFGR